MDLSIKKDCSKFLAAITGRRKTIPQKAGIVARHEQLSAFGPGEIECW
jgi:hypothetical protein